MQAAAQFLLRKKAGAGVARKATKAAKAPAASTALGTFLAGSAASVGYANALTAPGDKIKWTYSQLETYVHALSRGLLEVGCNKGDKVLLAEVSSTHAVVTALAAAHVGLPLVTSVDALSKAKSGIKVAVADTSSAQGAAILKAVPEITTTLPSLPLESSTGLKWMLATNVMQQTASTGAQTPFRDLLVLGQAWSPVPAAAAAVTGNDAFLVAGSTKIAHSAAASSAEALKDKAGLGSGSVVVMGTPVNTAEGLQAVLASVKARSCIAIPESLSAEAVAETVSRNSATALVADAELLNGLAGVEPAALASLKTVIAPGSASVPSSHPLSGKVVSL